MKPLCIVQNWDAESAGNLAAYFDENGIAYRVVKNYADEPLPKVSEIDAAVILGTPTSVRDYREHDYLIRLFAFISEAVRADLPLLSICFGSQLLAKALGADVVRNDVKEIGMYRATLTEAGQNDRLFAGIDPEFDVFHWHADTFMIPHGATLLATGQTCHNQAFRKGNAVGIQFHPEPRADEVPLWCDAYADELAQEGLTKEEIVTAYAEKAGLMRQLAARLMQNFLS